MEKIKAKIKDGAIEVRVTPEKNDGFFDYELDHLTRLRCRGLFKPVKVKGKSLIYLGPQGITLREKFSQPLSEVETFRYIEQVLNTFRKLTVNKMNPNSLILNMDYVYINPSTDELQFLYLPTNSGRAGVDSFGFLREMLYSNPMAQSQPFIRDFEGFLYTLQGFDWEAIEKYIASKHPAIVKAVVQSNAGQEGFPTVVEVNVGQEKRQRREDVSGRSYSENNNQGTSGNSGYSSSGRTSGGVSWIDNNEDQNRRMRRPEPANDKTMQIVWPDDKDPEATDFFDMDEGTVVMDEAMPEATLHQQSNNAIYHLKKKNFKIGKRNGDLVIPNNRYISRSHCEIYLYGGSYFLKDVGSKNGTFLNDTRLEPSSEVELHDGDEIRLADERFTFEMPSERGFS